MSRWSRLGPRTILIVGLLIYASAVALLSPGLPVAVARFFGIKPTDAFVALFIIPCVVVVIALIVLAARKAMGSIDH